MAVVVSVLLMLTFFLTTRSLKMVPSGLQFWLEVIIGGAYDFLLSVTKNEKATDKMFPLVMTLFLFILVGNLFAYVPGLGSISYNGTSIYRTITSDYSLVLVLTLISFMVTQSTLLFTGGFFAFFSKFINLTGPWKDKPINAFLGGMDLVGELGKILSLSFRLFGNMFAGEILGLVMFSLVPFILPLPFAILGLLTAVVQPTVFALFTALNITGNVVSKES